MTARNYSNTANVPVLTAGITALDTVLATNTISGWPSAPCFAVLDFGAASPEVVLVQSIGVGTMTILRGQGSTSAAIHTAGATITHMAVALDYSEANAHVNASTGVHGATGAVVGTTDTQTLTNKTLTSPGIDTATVRASTSAPGALIKAAASGGQDIEQWATSAAAVLGRVTSIGGLQAPTVSALNTVAASTPLTVKGAASQSGKLILGQNSSGTEQFGVDKLGKVFVNPASDESTSLVKVKLPVGGLSAYAYELQDSAGVTLWRVGALGDMIVTGLGLNSNGIFDKFNTVDTKFRIDSGSNIVMSGAKITADPTQANNVMVAPLKTGKRVHWSTQASVVMDGSGYATITHGAGFTPAQVSCWWNGQSLSGGAGPVIGTDTMTATTFRMRATVGATVSIAFVCYE